MKRATLSLLGFGFGLAVSAVSFAETAYTTKSVNLRAGPSRDYPLVARVPGGIPLEINGCVDDWTWCDVSLGLDRGWIYAGSLEYPYENRRVVILGHGPLFRFPVVTFSVGPYWDTYYRGRPWYSRRSYWDHRPPARHWVRPPSSHPPAVRPARPVVVRPPVVHPRPQPARPPVVRREAARPQPVRPAPARPDNKPRPAHRGGDRKPHGN